MPRTQQVEVEPLSPAAAPYQINIDDDGLPMEFKRHRHRKFVRWPKLRVNSLQIEGLDRVNWTDIRPNTNLSIIADVSVRNPNIASFEYNNASTILYYDGNIIGGAKTPGATAKAGRTLRLNVTMDILLAKVLNVSRLQADYLAGILPMSSYTRISGRVKILNIIKRGVVARTNCSMIVNVTSYTIKPQDCKRKVTL